MTYALITIVTIAIIVLVLWLIWYQITKPWQHLPTPKNSIPFIGHIFPLDRTKIIQFINKQFKDTGKRTVCVWLLWNPLVISIDVKLFEEVLKSTQYISKGNIYDFLKEWLGTGLLISDGKKWKTRRRMLTPAFHFDILKSNFDIINRHAKTFIETLMIQTKINEKPIEFFEITKGFSLNTLLESAMGITFGQSESKLNAMLSSYTYGVDILTSAVQERFVRPWLWSPFIYRNFTADGKEYYKQLIIANTFIRNVIDDRIETLQMEGNDNKRLLFLDILLDAYQKKEIDIEGIMEEVHTFMFEGHDTVSSSIAWAVYCIGRDKRVQGKIFEEINSISEEGFCMESLTQLKYTECVIKESLRLHPPVPVILRTMDTDVEIYNLKIPANTDTAFHLLVMQRDESIWKDAAQFKPERFVDDSFSKRNPFTYLPFSAGPRNCIGQRYAMMELKIVLFHLLKTFRLEATQEESELKQHIAVIHRADDGLLIKCIKRKEKEN